MTVSANNRSVSTGNFDFGANWLHYSKSSITHERIAKARQEFSSLVREISLDSKSFLDIGFGQGLSLLFAAEKGARCVGCDVNPMCAEALAITRKAGAFSVRESPAVVIGSILDEATVAHLRSLARDNAGFDVVHSWGVLHHTGNLALALRNACSLVTSGGHLIIALYNKHWTSSVWRIIKMIYNRLPSFGQSLVIGAFLPIIYAAKFAVTGANPLVQNRGMEFYHNVVDWVGGYPYEYASIDETVKILRDAGFEVLRSIPAQVPTGCNEFVCRSVNQPHANGAR